MKNRTSNRRTALLRTALSTHTTYVPAACALAMAMQVPASAQHISINFDDPQVADNQVADAGKNAGAIPTDGALWNNGNTNGGGSLADLMDSTGATTSAGVTWTSNNSWRSGSTGSTETSENGDLTRGYLDDGGNITIDMASPYLLNDIYVIHGTDQGNPATISAIGVNGTFYKGDGAGGTIAANGQNDGWSAVNWTDADTLTESDHYIKVLGQPGVQIEIFQSASGRGAVAGLQVANAYSGDLSYWDVNGAAAGSGDAGNGSLDGTWGSDTFWSADPTGESATAAWTSGNAAVFSAGTDGLSEHTVTVDGTQATDAIWVQEGGITFEGGTVDLSAGLGLLRDDDFGIIMNSAVTANNLSTVGYVELNSASNSISGDVSVIGDLFLAEDNTFGALSGTGFISTNAINLTIGSANNGGFTGALIGMEGATLEKVGTGVQSVGSVTPTDFGTITITEGTLQVGAGDLGATLSGAGNLEKSGGGTLTLSGTDYTGFTGKTIVSGGILSIPSDDTLGTAPGTPTADAITLRSGGRIQNYEADDGPDLVIPANRGITMESGNSGFDTLAGFTTTVDSPIVNGMVDDGNGGFVAATLTKAGGGTLILNGGSTHTGDTRLEGGVLDLRSEIPNSVNFRFLGSGALEMNDPNAVITTERFVTSDGSGATSVINQSDGVLNITGTNNSNTNQASFYMGHWGAGGASSVYNLSGGTINSLGAELSFGWDSASVAFNQTGGVMNVLGLDLGNGRNNAATYNLDGGALNLGANGITANANKTLNLGGGTLGAIDNWSTTQPLPLTGTVGDASFAPSAGYTMILGGGLSGTAGFSVDGPGTVVVGGEGTYAGTTTVNDGLLRIDGATATGASAVTVNGGGSIGAGGALTGTGSVSTLDLQDGSGSTFRLNFASPDMLTVATADGLSLTGSHTITALPAGQLVPGDEFMLIDYEGSIGGAGFAGFSIAALPNPHYAVSLVDNTEDTSIDLMVDSVDSITWTGAVDGAWDVNSTGNWETDSDMQSSNFYDFDVVSFVDGTGNTSLTLSGPINPAEVVFLNSADTFTLAGDGISGGGELAVSGGGTVILTNDNTYTGQTLVTSGTLQIGDGTSGSLSLSTTILNDDTVVINLPDGATFPNTIDGLGTTQVAGAGDLEFSGAVAGGGVLRVETAATTNFTGTGHNADFIITEGTTLINGGAWANSFFGDGIRSVTVQDGATIINETHTFGGLGAALYQPSITLESGSRWILAGEQYLSANNLTLDGGTVEIEADEDLRMQGGTCLVNATDGGSVIEGAGFVRLFGAVTFDVADGAAAGDLQINTPINESNSQSLTKAGDGTLVLSGDASHTGETLVDAGTLELTDTAALSGTSLVRIAAGAEVDATAAGLALGAGQAVGGDGTLDGNAILGGGAVSPGEVVGALSVTGDLALGEGSSYNWQVTDWTAAAGTGYDTVSADTLTFSATEGAPFTVFVSEDMLVNYDGSETTFTLVSTANGITGFDPLAVAVDATAFTSGFGDWVVSVSGNDLVLTFTEGGDPYLAWETANGIGGAGPTADSDGDGVDNCIEFVIGGDPNGTDSNGLLPTATTDETYLTFTFRRTDESAFYAPYVEYGSDLAGWTTAADGVDGVIITETDDGFGAGIDQVTVQIPRTLAAGSSLFARLRVDIP